MMLTKGRMEFCTECRKDTEYVLKKKNIKKVIRDKEYDFSITIAVCTECGEEINIPGLIDKNIQEIDEQYRTAEGIVTVKDIEKLMEIYNIGKAPLSIALGFGEVTVTRYLSGQVPSKEYSEIIKSALTSPEYMKQLLAKNREKIATSAYNKSMNAANELSDIFSVSPKMLMVISYLFEKLKEVTPLMLQKLLYFIQGVHLALYDRPIFEEKCEAWIHGPVYPSVYRLFKDFKYNPIEDARFAVINGKYNELSSDEQKVVQLVADTFGMYSAKTLENITHNEAPWVSSRVGRHEGMPSQQKIPKEIIGKYYEEVNEKYGINRKEGLHSYILFMLSLEEG